MLIIMRNLEDQKKNLAVISEEIYKIRIKKVRGIFRGSDNCRSTYH